jgi:hypothetical protein
MRSSSSPTEPEAWGARATFRVLLFDLRSPFLQSFVLIQHFHHVARDIDTDRSAKTRSIEYCFFR